MPFDTPIFLFYFLPAALVIFFVFARFSINVPVLIISLAFYAWGEPLFVLWVLASSVFDWLAMRYFRPGTVAFRIVLAICIVQNASLLFIFKYWDFAIANLDRWAAGHFGFLALQILVPLGISFIAFEKITYVVDIGRRTAQPAESLADYLAYVFLFPKLIAGPIVKYHEIADQLRSRRIDREDLVCGVARACFGLAKKVLIADNAGDIANQIFSLPPGQLGFAGCWIGAIAFTVQIYFDFSGYSDIAIGLARVMGFRLRENFYYPYTALNFTDFWRRWHISLSSWIREYVYLPLGGNRLGSARTYANLWIAFLLSGAWHGAAWNFILWGAFHGLFLAADKAFWLRVSTAMPTTVQRALTLFLVIIGWVLFRAQDGQAAPFLMAMFNPWAASLVPYVKPEPIVFTALGVVLILLPWSGAYWRVRDRWAAYESRRTIELIVAGALLFLSIGKIAVSSHHVFLYFRF